MATRTGARIKSYEHPLPGRHGETLSTDLARIGKKNAQTVLLVQSGTHGIEGYCGSAIQVAFLELLSDKTVTRDTAIYLVHGINPFGFSWSSRCDENNVDLNRNFIDFCDDSQTQNDIFAELAPYLLPDEWTRKNIAEANARLNELRCKYGLVSRSLRQGQYAYPENIFYGGARPSWSRRTVERITGEFLTCASKIIFLDIHSGLGNYGQAVLLSVEPDTSENFKRLQKIFGSLVRSTRNPNSAAANAGGNIIRGYAEQLPGSMLLGAGIEFGTYDQARVQNALRADAWLRYKKRVREISRYRQRKIKQELLEAFCPMDQAWRDRVVTTGCKICQTALDGLATL